MLHALSIFFRLMVCASFLSSTWPAVAQQRQDTPGGSGARLLQQLQDQQTRINGLESRLNELGADNSVLTDLVKAVLAQQAATAKLAEFAKADPPSLKQDAEKLLPRADTALKTLAPIPTASLGGGDLKARIETCIKNAKSAAETLLKNPAGKPPGTIDACSDVDQRAILAELEKLRNEGVKEWQRCQSVLDRAGTIGATSLPRAPTTLSASSAQDVVDKLKQLKGAYDQTQGAARDCIGTLENTFNQIRDQESAAAAMSMALGMAAQVCAATGGNPYVCGAMLVVAILMNLFKGGGDGDGKNKGSGEGPENVAGVNSKNVTTASLPGPTDSGGAGCTNCGDFGAIRDGIVGCNTNAKTLTCWRRDTPQIQLVIDPAKSLQANSAGKDALIAAIANKQSNRLFFCLQQAGPQFLDGLLLATDKPDEYFSIRVNYPQAGLELSYISPAVQARPGDKPEDICGLQFRK
jgi:hypothetical protein